MSTLPRLRLDRGGQRCPDLREHVGRAHGDRGARTVDTGDARGVEHRVILLRHDAADEHHDVVRPLLAQLRDERGHQRLVTRGERRDADRVHISGVATDEESVRDVYISVYNPSRNLFGSQEKVFGSGFAVASCVSVE